jgi:hypothetical protein
MPCLRRLLTQELGMNRLGVFVDREHALDAKFLSRNRLRRANGRDRGK